MGHMRRQPTERPVLVVYGVVQNNSNRDGSTTLSLKVFVVASVGAAWLWNVMIFRHAKSFEARLLWRLQAGFRNAAGLQLFDVLKAEIEQLDVVANVKKPSFPQGIDIQVFPLSLLASSLCLLTPISP